MEHISQREMRNNSAEVLRRVAAGETFIVTNGGEPAAVLSPIVGSSRQRLIIQGRLRVSPTPLDPASLPSRAVLSVDLQQLLDEDRGDR